MVPQRTVAEVLAELDRACDVVGHAHAAIATDGDGTLWKCDVGELLFAHALAEDWVGLGALAELRREAERYGVAGRDRLETLGARDIVQSLWTAYCAREYPENRVCEVMAWCMAGVRVDALELACATLLEGTCSRLPLREQWIDESIAVLRWAARRRVPVYLVSASPSPIVEAAARVLATDRGVPEPRVLAMNPHVEDGIVRPALTGIAPYGEGKWQALSHALDADGKHVLLTALGDNSFDAPMLRASRLPLAIRPKPALVELASTIPGLFELVQS